MRRAKALGPVAAGLLVLFAAGCGSDDHPNENRPPDTIELTAKVTKDEVTIAPTKVGAGQAHVTIANLSRDRVQPTFEGPEGATGDVIEPGNVGSVELLLAEGTYSVGPGPDSQAAPDELVVGPPRESSQNELLLP